MIFEIVDKDMLVLFGLALFWLAGMSLANIGSIETIGYTMRKGYEYICSDCGMLVPEKYYHSYKECQLREGKPKHPDHRCYSGSKPYWRAPDWHSTLEEQRQ